MQITAEYFREELLSFRKIMCSKLLTLKQKTDAFDALTIEYLNLPEDAIAEKQFYVGTSYEWGYRSDYEEGA